MDKKRSFHGVLSKYLPEEFVSYVVQIIMDSGVRFKIVAPRSTKLGDFKVNSKKNDKPQITVNGDLNPYAFLITTLHELAHLNTHMKYGNNVSPHGKEWKNEFALLLDPVLTENFLPNKLKIILTKSIKNLKASSCSDLHLSRELKKYDTSKNTITLEELEENSIFELNKKIFSKGYLRRTRYLCKEKDSGKSYLVHALAEVKKIE